MTHIRVLTIALAVGTLSGCSGYGSADFYAIEADSTLERFVVHDWYETETTGPSLGNYRPPAYAFTQAKRRYLIYPVLIKSGAQWIGPPLIPIIPIWLFDEPKRTDELVLRIRSFPLNPSGAELFHVELNATASKKILFEKERSDAVGTVYSARLPHSDIGKFLDISIGLGNGEMRDFRFAWRRERIYSPLFSFNGPNPRPSLKRYGS